MRTSQSFPVTHESHVGQVRRGVGEIAQRHSLNDTDAGRVALVASELGHNLVRHAGGGELIVRECPTGATYGIELISIDRGPGIPNIAEAFRDGYSTGGTAGTGLGAIRRLSDRFDIYTQPNRGSVASAFIGNENLTQPFLIGVISLPLKGEIACGDGWDYLESDSTLSLLLVDGLGHGPFAEDAARAATATFRASRRESPAATLEAIHQALGATRGAAGAILKIDLRVREVTTAGVGNISMRAFSEDRMRSLISENGTLGSNLRRVEDAGSPWTTDTLIVMHSDGIESKWDLKEYPGVTFRHPSLLAALLYRDHQRERDDSTVVVLKGALR